VGPRSRNGVPAGGPQAEACSLASELGVDAEHALARSRGHAFTEGQSISEVAHEILAKRLRLEPAMTGSVPSCSVGAADTSSRSEGGLARDAFSQPR
jgi:hypothetical protein